MRSSLMRSRVVPRVLLGLVATLIGLGPGASHATLYAVTSAGTVFESTNDGIAWAVKGDLPEPEVVSISPGLTSGTLFALGKTGSVYQSTSSGAGWSAIGNVGASDCVAIAVARSGALLALTSSGDVSRSTSAGATWTRESNVGASDCISLAVGGKVGSNDTLFVATSSGDIARLPSGTSWSTVGSTSFTPLVDLLWISATLYALTDAGEFLMSSNAGATWSAIGTISQVGMRDLAYVASKFKAISQEGEVYESATGTSWSSTWIGTTNQVFTVAFAPGVPEFQTGIGRPPGPSPHVTLRAFPNPFAEVVQFALAGVSDGTTVEVAIYDAAGRRVAQVHSGLLRSAEQELSWRPGEVAGGVYFVRVRVDVFTETQPLILIR